MGRRYAETGQAAATSEADIIICESATTIRPAIYDIIMGTNGTAADNALLWVVERTEAAATGGSGVTPVALDFDDPASLCTVTQAPAGTTITASTELLEIAANQRATQRWAASPGGALKMPDLANYGIVCNVRHASYTGNCQVVFHHEE